MLTLLLTLFLFAGVMLIMAVGVIVVGKRLRGSCGGVGDCHCTDDGVPPESCTRSKEDQRPGTEVLEISGS